MSNYNYTESYGPCQSQPPCPGKVCNPLKNCCTGVHIPDFDCEDARPILTRFQEIYDYKNAFGTPATDTITASTTFSISLETTNCNPCCACNTCTISSTSIFNIESVCTRVISAQPTATLTATSFSINGQQPTSITATNPNLYNLDISGITGLPSQNCVDCDKGTKANLITNSPFFIVYRLEHTICGTVSTSSGLCKFYSIFTNSFTDTTTTGSSIFIQNLCIAPKCTLSIPSISLALCYDAELINPRIVPGATAGTVTLLGTVYIVPTVEAEVQVSRRKIVLVNDYIPQPSPQQLPKPCDCNNLKCRPKPNCKPEPPKPCDCDCDQF
ncbi:hypothetical protein SAMN02745163_02692 [Clostridium cavendishii DSM 21758]|uniref:Uncharacterized protein n=1 Tax=Clostridium cavendishii DSM 21758 TaxID=1121302 RepID=A0A1M6MMA5_9CLOT|nr:hypothetical protein [Clostridium cavendishii]SHJ84611.1 hypothetical protein SAMN02745163_02692 [Clostridium cavendishii DSM 21758]